LWVRPGAYPRVEQLKGALGLALAKITAQQIEKV